MDDCITGTSLIGEGGRGTCGRYRPVLGVRREVNWATTGETEVTEAGARRGHTAQAHSEIALTNRSPIRRLGKVGYPELGRPGGPGTEHRASFAGARTTSAHREVRGDG